MCNNNRKARQKTKAAIREKTECRSAYIRTRVKFYGRYFNKCKIKFTNLNILEQEHFCVSENRFKLDLCHAVTVNSFFIKLCDLDGTLEADFLFAGRRCVMRHEPVRGVKCVIGFAPYVASGKPCDLAKSP